MLYRTPFPDNFSLLLTTIRRTCLRRSKLLGQGGVFVRFKREAHFIPCFPCYRILLLPTGYIAALTSQRMILNRHRSRTGRRKPEKLPIDDRVERRDFLYEIKKEIFHTYIITLRPTVKLQECSMNARRALLLVHAKSTYNKRSCISIIDGRSIPLKKKH